MTLFSSVTQIESLLQGDVSTKHVETHTHSIITLHSHITGIPTRLQRETHNECFVRVGCGCRGDGSHGTFRALLKSVLVADGTLQVTESISDSFLGSFAPQAQDKLLSST